MRQERSQNTKRARRINRLVLVFSLAFVLCAVLYVAITNSAPAEANHIMPVHTANGTLHVTFIDVGQGDSILVTCGEDDVMLIDAGEAKNVQAVKDELDERGITQIDVIVATHPHADHIGGITEMIDAFEVGRVYMPDMQSDSKTYQNLRDSIENHHVLLIEAYAGESFELGGAACTIVSPDKDDNKDANNESVMLLLDYLDSEFLFTGDAEEWAENEVLGAGYHIDADVLKVAHHGSSTGTSEAFLQAVTPDYAIISCGIDNKYGHPHEETLDLLNKYGIDTLRTDILGDVDFVSDGYHLQVNIGD